MEEKLIKLGLSKNEATIYLFLLKNPHITTGPIIKETEEIVPELKKLKTEKEFRTNTAIFEGFEGFKTAFKKIIDDCPKEESIYILGFSEQPYATESLRIFLTNMNLKSLQKKQKLKILLDSSVRETLGKDREKEKNTEVKYMPKGYISPSAIDIFEDY